MLGVKMPRRGGLEAMGLREIKVPYELGTLARRASEGVFGCGAAHPGSRVGLVKGRITSRISPSGSVQGHPGKYRSLWPVRGLIGQSWEGR